MIAFRLNPCPTAHPPKNEDELRTLWSDPTTRRALLSQLAETGFGPAQLREISTMISAENSDLFDVLAYIAFALAPQTRSQRVETHRPAIHAPYNENLRAFLDFVLAQYIKQGVEEPDDAKISRLITLKYGTANDARAQLGDLHAARAAFIGFQRHLYET